MNNFKRYESFNDMLSGSEYARLYFNSLSSGIKNAVLKNTGIIRSEDDLYNFVQGEIHDFN